MKRRAVVWGVGAAAAVGGAGFGLWRLRADTDASLPADFWTLSFERPEGGELRMSSLSGQPVLLNFWATWCAPCIKELPLLDRFQREQAGRWQVVGLAVDGPTPVREFLLKQPLGFPVGLAGLNGVELARSLGNAAGGLPFSVLIDAKGQPRERKLGALTEQDLLRWARLA